MFNHSNVYMWKKLPTKVNLTNTRSREDFKKEVVFLLFLLTVAYESPEKTQPGKS